MKWVGLLLGIIALTACATSRPIPEEEPPVDNKKMAIINTKLGLAYLQRHDLQRAKQKLLLALDKDPELPDAWYSMAYFLELTGDTKQANTYYLKSLDLAPRRGDVENNYGTFLCRQGAYQKAIQHFMVAVQDSSYLDAAGAYENAALCALKIPNRKLAQQFFKKSLNQEHNRPSVLAALKKLETYPKSFNKGYRSPVLTKK